MKTFSPTEFPYVRHEQGGIGRKLQHGCSTISVRDMKTLAPLTPLPPP